MVLCSIILDYVLLMGSILTSQYLIILIYLVVLLVYVLLIFDHVCYVHCYCELAVMDYFVIPSYWIGMVQMLLV